MQLIKPEALGHVDNGIIIVAWRGGQCIIRTLGSSTILCDGGLGWGVLCSGEKVQKVSECWFPGCSVANRPGDFVWVGGYSHLIITFSR